MSKYKTISDERLNDWEWDECHIFEIYFRSEHLIDWFKNIPDCQDNEFSFRKLDDQIVLIHCEAPYWIGDLDDDGIEELDQIVLDRLHLKPEWVRQMLYGLKSTITKQYVKK